jgi:hypothetical protein
VIARSVRSRNRISGAGCAQSALEAGGAAISMRSITGISIRAGATRVMMMVTRAPSSRALGSTRCPSVSLGD